MNQKILPLALHGAYTPSRKHRRAGSEFETCLDCIVSHYGSRDGNYVGLAMSQNKFTSYVPTQACLPPETLGNGQTDRRVDNRKSTGFNQNTLVPQLPYR